MTNHIYTITTFELGFKYANRNRSADGAYHSFYKRTSKAQRQYLTTLSSNTTGWFSRLEDAQNSVICNDLDLHEQSNDYVVIEKLEEGPISCLGLEQWWYKWDEGKYKPCKCPEDFKAIIGFWNRTDRYKNDIPKIEFEYPLDDFSLTCAKDQHSGCCCCCKHQGKVHNHCMFTIHKKIGKCSCGKSLGFYICNISMVMQADDGRVFLNGHHGFCEMYEERPKKV